ncbi:hypothetical protein PMAYCL1PPCAC_14242, partial [Pristionchus mayeri]
IGISQGQLVVQNARREVQLVRQHCEEKAELVAEHAKREIELTKQVFEDRGKHLEEQAKTTMYYYKKLNEQRREHLEEQARTERAINYTIARISSAVNLDDGAKNFNTKMGIIRQEFDKFERKVYKLGQNRKEISKLVREKCGYLTSQCKEATG